MTELEVNTDNVEIPVSFFIEVDSIPDDIYVRINGRKIKISKQKLEKLLLTLQE